MIEGKRYLDMKPSGKDSLARHCMGLLAYRRTNIEIIDFDPDEYLNDLAKQIAATSKPA